VRTLALLFDQRGESAFIRAGLRPRVHRQGCKALGGSLRTRDRLHRPGSPWENAYSETFKSRFSDELLKREVFANLPEAKVLVKECKNHYNRHRPHSALGTGRRWSLRRQMGRPV
jgi:putative transposase